MTFPCVVLCNRFTRHSLGLWTNSGGGLESRAGRDRLSWSFCPDHTRGPYIQMSKLRLKEAAQGHTEVEAGLALLPHQCSPPGPVELLILSPKSSPMAHYPTPLPDQSIGCILRMPPLMPFGDPCAFVNERNTTISCRPDDLKALWVSEAPTLPDAPACPHSLRALGPQVTYNGLFPLLPGMPDAWRSV